MHKLKIQWKESSLEIPRWSIYLAYTLLTFGTYAMFLQKHYSIDSYLNYPILTTGTMLGAGRFGFYLINVLFNALHINLVEYQSIFTFLFIITIIFILSSVFFRLVKEYSIQNPATLIALFFGISLTLINVYILEWFLFPEVALIYSIALLLAYYSSVVLLGKSRISSILLSILLLFLSMLFYQGSLPTFITWSYLFAIFSWKESTPKKEKIWSAITPALVGIASVALSFVSSLLYQSFENTTITERAELGSFSEIFSYFRLILAGQKTIFLDASGFLPAFTMLLFIFATIILLILMNSQEKTSTNLLLVIFMAMVIWGSTFFPHLFLGIVWLAPRSITGVFCLVAFLFIVAVCWCNEELYKKILAVVIVVFVGINIFQIHVIGNNHYKSNALDKEYALLVEEQILQYETMSGNTITKIAPIRDSIPMQGYPDIQYASYEINMRAYFATWADVEALNYFTGEHYEKITFDNETLRFELLGKNWDTFVPEEQLIFDGDTLYWVIY